MDTRKASSGSVLLEICDGGAHEKPAYIHGLTILLPLTKSLNWWTSGSSEKKTKVQLCRVLLLSSDQSSGLQV